MTEKKKPLSDWKRYDKTPKAILTSELSDAAVRAYAYFDCVQGKSGNPAEGFTDSRGAIHMSQGKFGKAVTELVDAGLIEVEKPLSEGDAYREQRYQVVHNPTREHYNPDPDRVQLPTPMGRGVRAKRSAPVLKPGTPHKGRAVSESDTHNQASSVPETDTAAVPNTDTADPTRVPESGTGPRSQSGDEQVITAQGTLRNGKAKAMVKGTKARDVQDKSTTSIIPRDKPTNEQCMALKRAQYALEWDWVRVAKEIEAITGRGDLKSFKNLTKAEAPLILTTLSSRPMVKSPPEHDNKAA